MPEATIVITGADSYLGSSVLRHLLASTDARITGLVHPKGGPLAERNRVLADGGGRVEYVEADLTRAIPGEGRQALGRADRVLHFAWVRGKDLDGVRRDNEGMIDALAGASGSAAKLVFISSVAASPRARSVYGRAKYHAMELVARLGGVSLVCGLVVDRVPRGPFAMLSGVVRRLPFSIRFTGAGVKVYPVMFDDVLRGVALSARAPLKPGNYRLFPGARDLNEFLALLESVYPRRRPAVPVSAGFLIRAASIARGARLAPPLLVDKILTFLHKEPEYLAGHRALPGMEFREVTVEVLRGTAPPGPDRFD